MTPVAESAPATQAPRKGVSPWADSWRRLKKNKAAMAGVVVIVFMALACVLGPGILHASSGLEPSYGFNWLNARGPGFTHPDVLNTTELELGRPPVVRPVYRDAARIELLVSERRSEDVRIVVRRGKVDEIRIGAGAMEVERLELRAPAFLREEHEDKTQGPDLTDLNVVKGEPLPAAFGARKRSVALVLRRFLGSDVQVRYAAETSPGTAEVQDPDGTRRSVPVRLVSALTREGEPIQRAALEGIHVLEVRAHGELRTVRHLLGTDISGRDLLARILVGGRISLLVGLIATLVSLCIGVVYGAVAGYAGGRVDTLMMATVDVLYGIPYMFLVILLLVNFGRDIKMLFVALGAVQWLTMSRIVRGQILSLKQKEFVEAARMSGSGPGAILFRHLVPNTLGVVVVYTTLTVPAVILQESFLSFIGLSVTYQGENWESWGALVKAGVDAPDNAKPWLLVLPSLAMAVTLFSLNFFGDGLRDALDPRQRGKT